MAWHNAVRAKLESARLFIRVESVGGKIRAIVDSQRFLDIYFDPTTNGYSYALIDQAQARAGDQRVFGWDDFPHIGSEEFRKLSSYPHHFQRRVGDTWVFEESPMRGRIETDIDVVIEYVSRYFQP